MIDANRYQPKRSATKKQAPVPMVIVVAAPMFASATYQVAAAAMLKPIVAQMKIRTKTKLVRMERNRKTKDSMARVSG